MVEKLIKHAHKRNRRKQVKLYTLKPGEKLSDRVLLNELKENANVIYDMSYESLLAYFDDPQQKLYRDDDLQLYFFKTSPSSQWYELPFEFSAGLKKQLFSPDKQ